MNRRIVTAKVFESYTPVELALKDATIENAQWSSEMERTVAQAMGRPMRHDWKDRYFNKYVNDRFPLPAAAAPDVAAFEAFVLDMERAYVPQPRITAAWFHSLPEGQVGYRYPQMDYREEPPSFSLFR